MPSTVGMTAPDKATFEQLVMSFVPGCKAKLDADYAAKRAGNLLNAPSQIVSRPNDVSKTQGPTDADDRLFITRKRPREEAQQRPAQTSDMDQPILDSISSPESFPSPKRKVSERVMVTENLSSRNAIPILTLPDWYQPVIISRKHDRSEVVNLKKIREAVEKCRTNPHIDLSRVFDELRDRIHDAEFSKVDEVVVRNTRLLEPKLGFPLIFNSEEVAFPFDIKADAQQLWTRWSRRRFDTDLYRGINAGKESSKKGRMTASLKPHYEDRVEPDMFGHNSLVNGQWWPSQIATLRDGAHGSAQGGIYGKKGEGAYSVVLAGGHHSGGRYDDVDNGDVIWYCGTDGENGQISEGTQRLLESVNRNPVRVLRSQNLPQHNTYRPEKGYRYDGLYDVVSYEVVDRLKQAHRFHLIRQPNQDPIRSRALGRAERPTAKEKAEYEELRKKLASMGEKLS